MKILSIAAAAAFVLAGTAAWAADDTAILAPVNGFLDATDGPHADIGKASGYWISGEQSVVDEFAPYHWTGPGAVRAWWAGFVAQNKNDAFTDMVMKRSAPRVLTGGGHAYVTVPSSFDFKVKGQPQHLEGVLTFALDRTAKGWRIASFAWAGEKMTP